MSTDLSLHHRRRKPTADELADIPWLPLLQPHERTCAEAVLMVGDALPGDHVCRLGKPVTYWFGVVEGLLKMSSDNAQGQSITFSGLPPGGWFGEGTALKREAYRYNIQALRKSVVAGLPVDTFHWLLDHSIGFNRFVMNQLNERLGQFIAAREIDRLNSPNVRVARSLAALVQPGAVPRCGRGAAHHPAGAGLSWWGCRASASMKRSPRWRHGQSSVWNTAACASWTWGAARQHPILLMI
jgi:CRP/FNR family cyclic AMP-dependent transcriptional regulator